LDIDIGMGKTARRGYELDDIAIVPSRRTRDRRDVDVTWQLDAFGLELPVMVAAMDAIVSPMSAIALGRLGGLAVLNLEGLWTRYEDPAPLIAEIARIEKGRFTACLQEIYAEPVKPELITARVAQIAASGVVTCGALSPQRAVELAPAAIAGELDVLAVIGSVVSADRVSKSKETLDLARLIRELDISVVVGGCASYQAALHLMRTGAVGVLVGIGSDASVATRKVLGVGAPQASAIADAAAARSRHIEETGVYVQVIAAGGMRSGGDIAKAVACGADAVMIGSPLASVLDAPGHGVCWDLAAAHPSLPRGGRVDASIDASFEEILLGPSHDADGRTNLIGALRSSMALCGYGNVREFHKAEVVALRQSDHS
jgi:IMP dehydrogenase